MILIFVLCIIGFLWIKAWFYQDYKPFFGGAFIAFIYGLAQLFFPKI